MLSFRREKKFTRVYNDGVDIGLICRRDCIVGYAQEIPSGWTITRDKRKWEGNYPTRRIAGLALLGIFPKGQDIPPSSQPTLVS